MGWPREAPAQPPVRVILDAGHGGQDHGIERNGLREKDLALEFSQALAGRLSGRADLLVVETRKRDYALSLEERRRQANSAGQGEGQSVYLSFHLAGAPDAKVRGARIFLNGAPPPADNSLLVPLELAHGPAAAGSLRLASALTQAYLARQIDARTIMAPQLLAPLLGLTMPAVLIELDFLTTTDSSRWRDPQTREDLLDATVAGLDRFLQARKNAPP